MPTAEEQAGPLAPKQKDFQELKGPVWPNRWVAKRRRSRRVPFPHQSRISRREAKDSQQISRSHSGPAWPDAEDADGGGAGGPQSSSRSKSHSAPGRSSS